MKSLTFCIVLLCAGAAAAEHPWYTPQALSPANWLPVGAPFPVYRPQGAFAPRYFEVWQRATAPGVTDGYIVVGVLPQKPRTGMDTFDEQPPSRWDKFGGDHDVSVNMNWEPFHWPDGSIRQHPYWVLGIDHMHLLFGDRE